MMSRGCWGKWCKDVWSQFMETRQAAQPGHGSLGCRGRPTRASSNDGKKCSWSYVFFAGAGSRTARRALRQGGPARASRRRMARSGLPPLPRSLRGCDAASAVQEEPCRRRRAQRLLRKSIRMPAQAQRACAAHAAESHKASCAMWARADDSFRNQRPCKRSGVSMSCRFAARAGGEKQRVGSCYAWETSLNIGHNPG